MLIDMTLILVVTKVYAPPFNRAAACGACRGGGGIGEHCICMAYTSKIGDRLLSRRRSKDSGSEVTAKCYCPDPGWER